MAIGMGEEPSREDLLEAREQLQKQLALVENPMRSSDRNPQLVAKLQAMIAEIDGCLSGPAEMDKRTELTPQPR